MPQEGSSSRLRRRRLARFSSRASSWSIAPLSPACLAFHVPSTLGRHRRLLPGPEAEADSFLRRRIGPSAPSSRHTQACSARVMFMCLGSRGAESVSGSVRAQLAGPISEVGRALRCCSICACDVKETAFGGAEESGVGIEIVLPEPSGRRLQSLSMCTSRCRRGRVAFRRNPSPTRTRKSILEYGSWAACAFSWFRRLRHKARWCGCFIWWFALACL